MIYSFDIFDTVVCRPFYDPRFLFSCAEKILRDKNIIMLGNNKSWMNIRSNAEIRCRKSINAEEVTLDEIYEQLSKDGYINNKYIEQAKNIEIDLELKCCTPIDNTIQRIKELRKNNQKVIFISDTYLSQNVITNILHKAGVYRENDKIYLSSFYRKTKHTGSLYAAVLADLSLKPNQIYHVGDNNHSDYNIPSKMGIRTELYSWSHPNRYEVLSIDESPDNVYYKGLIRFTRLTVNAFKKKNYDDYLPLMCNVVAPLLFAYIQWVIEDAVRNKINALYFVSRDGQIFLRIAQVICKKRKLSLELKYLYGSRQAWFLPAMYAVDDAEFTWVSDDNAFISVTSLFARYNIVPEVYKETLMHNGFNPERWNNNLNTEERFEIKSILTCDPVKSGILESSLEQRKLLLAYLEYVGFFADKNKAIVDIGWHGRMQAALQNIVRNERDSNTTLKGYYFYNCKNIEENKDYRSFLVGKANSHTIVRYDYMLEIFTYADHGGVTGYTLENNGSVIPVLDSNGIESIGILPVNNYHHCIELIIEKMIQQIDQYSYPTIRKIKDFAIKNFVRFCERPSFEEVQLLVSTKYSDEQKIYKKHDVILSTKIMTLLKWIFRGRSRPFTFLWMEGILMYNVQNKMIRSIFMILLRLKNTIKRY